MTQGEILKEFEQMSVIQQLNTIKSAIQILEERFLRNEQSEETVLPLREAAKLLYDDYSSDSELVAFTALDWEDLYAEE